MLRRTLVIAAVAALLAAALTACTLPASPGLSLLNRIVTRAPRSSQATVALAAASATASAMGPITQTATLTVTQSAVMSVTLEVATAIGTPVQLSPDPTLQSEVKGTATPEPAPPVKTPRSMFESPISTDEASATPEVIPSVIIEFPTPEETATPTEEATATLTPTTVPATLTPTTVPATLTPTTVPATLTPTTVPATLTPTTVPVELTSITVPASPTPSPTVGPGPTEVAPTKEPLPTPTPPAPPPTPPVPPPTEPAPTSTPPAPIGSAPEIVWLSDGGAFRPSKVMGWTAGRSDPIAVAGKSNTTNRIASFSVSSGGAWLAYTLTDSPFLFEAQLGGTQQRKIVPPRLGWRFRIPKWSPAGDRLAFIAEFQPALGAAPVNVGLWTSAPDGSDLHQVVRADGVFNQGVTFADWHPNGTELIYAFTGPSGVALAQWLSVASTGGAPRFLPLAGTLYDISPDGTWLLGDGYTSVAPQNRRQMSYNALMRIPSDGKSAPSLLTPACRSDIEGRISPDGSRVLALSWPSISPACPRVTGPVKYELWVMNSDGSRRAALDAKNNIGREFPQWSADGQSIYYSVLGAKGYEIWKADANGATPPVAVPGTLGADRFRVVR
jgi:Tol biopolymer transport system component